MSKINHADRLRSFAESIEAVCDATDELGRIVKRQASDNATLRLEIWEIIKAFHGWSDSGGHVYSSAEQVGLITAWIRKERGHNE